MATILSILVFLSFYDISFSTYGPTTADAPRDLATLTFDLGGHGLNTGLRVPSVYPYQD